VGQVAADACGGGGRGRRGRRANQNGVSFGIFTCSAVKAMRNRKSGHKYKLKPVGGFVGTAFANRYTAFAAIPGRGGGAVGDGDYLNVGDGGQVEIEHPVRRRQVPGPTVGGLGGKGETWRCKKGIG